ncbi:MAG: hypothetical protein QF893_05555 [Alphaproteobacteria bacterium]|jgi:hypothetical protein|nr:hypothetical protein [Alphaproteobacteria bacterium]
MLVIGVTCDALSALGKCVAKAIPVKLGEDRPAPGRRDNALAT